MTEAHLFKTILACINQPRKTINITN